MAHTNAHVRVHTCAPASNARVRVLRCPSNTSPDTYAHTHMLMHTQNPHTQHARERAHTHTRAAVLSRPPLTRMMMMTMMMMTQPCVRFPRWTQPLLVARLCVVERSGEGASGILMTFNTHRMHVAPRPTPPARTLTTSSHHHNDHSSPPPHSAAPSITSTSQAKSNSPLR